MNIKDIRGQEYAKRAMEVALAGQHNVLLTGPSGQGKTLLCEWAIEKTKAEGWIIPDWRSHFDLPASPSWFEGDGTFWLMAESWDCPCGNYTHPYKACLCEIEDIRHFRSRLAETANYCDIHIGLPPIPFEKLWSKRDGETDERVMERVVRAREAQMKRQGKLNGELEFWELRELCKLDPTSENLLKAAYTQLMLSPREVHSSLKVCLTIRDLDSRETDIRTHHLAEALQYRSRIESYKSPMEVAKDES